MVRIKSDWGNYMMWTNIDEKSIIILFEFAPKRMHVHVERSVCVWIDVYK